MYRTQGKSVVDAVKLVFRQIEGSASVAIEFADNNSLVLLLTLGPHVVASDKARVLFSLQRSQLFNKL